MSTMSNSDCATVIKRGYLSDKKAGILEQKKKKWFVLRQDPVMGYCILEYFKDERSWTRREPPKGFINVRDIVEVMRVPDKRQTIELLCPGIGYRLMANSEADADDWAEAVRRLIVYRKDVRSMSFPSVLSQGTSSSCSLSSSPPNFPYNTGHCHLSNNALAIPPTVNIDGLHLSQHSPSQHRLQHQFPTPPETIVDTTNPLTTSRLQKQVSNDSVNPYPSPPSSNDSASMCGSATSFDNGSLLDGNEAELFHRVCSKFRVSINDTDKFSTQGECDLIVNEIGMTLISPANGNQIATWPLGSVRRYGVNSVCFTFESGRYSSTGEGQFFLYSHQSRLIYNKIHFAILRMNNNKDPRRPTVPLDSTPLATGSSTIIPTSRIPSINADSSSSPPQYNHIEHHLKQSPSHEMYTKLQQTSPSAFSSCSSFSAFATPYEYEKLSHSPHILHSNTISVSNTKPAPFHTQSYPEPVYSTLKEVDGDNVGTIDDIDDSLTTMSDDPPPIPPRLSKVTSI